MNPARLFALAVVGASLPAAASAQSQPTTVPGSPYARPVDETGDRVDSASEQLRRGLNQVETDAAAKRARAAQHALYARAATARDIVAGAIVTDKYGNEVGKVGSVDKDGAVVATALGSVKVPLDAFGKTSKGLLLDMDKTQFDALVSQANKKAGG